MKTITFHTPQHLSADRVESFMLDCGAYTRTLADGSRESLLIGETSTLIVPSDVRPEVELDPAFCRRAKDRCGAPINASVAIHIPKSDAGTMPAKALAQRMVDEWGGVIEDIGGILLPKPD